MNYYVKSLTSSAVLAMSCFGLFGQNKYWVYFKDKEKRDPRLQYVSDETISNRIAAGADLEQYTDLPVRRQYVKTLASIATVHVKSKWLNAVSATLDAHQLDSVKKMESVERTELINGNIYLASTGSMDYSQVLQKINIKAFSDAGLSGKGVVIGIIDGRFSKADANQNLFHIFKQGLVMGTKDFVETRQEDFFKASTSEGDMHGTRVWQLIAGESKKQQVRLGAAYNASFYLARAEDSEKEYRKEEDYWLAAMEWMDSLGVKLVNASLGYSVDFTDPSENYRPSELNGMTSAIAKAAQIATSEKGMIIVVSAGNQGANSNWKIISTPADAQGVITVGAMDTNGQRHEVSGVGPEFLDYVKPDLSCYSELGTSLAAPVITGLIACMLQKEPSLTNTKIASLMKKSAHLYPYANNFVGYGIPDAGRILMLMRNDQTDFKRSKEIRKAGNEVVLKLRRPSGPVVVFHKRSEYNVINQEVFFPLEKKVKIQRLEEATRTTVALQDEVIEIFWLD
jgi:subtilisin family serine protease